MLDGLIDENVQYVEFRGWPGEDEAIREARLRDPDFAVKFIPAGGRGADRDSMRGMLERVVAERERDPGRAVGFDLIQEEDRTHGTLFFAEQILAARRELEGRGLSLPLFLHSGETNRAESENLYDALLLGAPRIGHGLALVRHPLLMQMARDRGVAVEVCPISNQVLGYVADLRAHPAVAYINAGMAVVLSPDDPGMMRHTFSHDFYMAFMALGPRPAGAQAARDELARPLGHGRGREAARPRGVARALGGVRPLAERDGLEQRRSGHRLAAEDGRRVVAEVLHQQPAPVRAAAQLAEVGVERPAQLGAALADGPGAAQRLRRAPTPPRGRRACGVAAGSRGHP